MESWIFKGQVLFKKVLKYFKIFLRLNIYVILLSLNISCFRIQEIPVFNLTQSGQQPITWGEILEKGKKVAYENPFEMMLWYPDGHLRSNKFLHNLCVIFYHWIPAYFIDFLMLIFSQKRL